MNKFLVDTGALLAMIDSRDKYHQAAVAFTRTNTNATYYVPETVFMETMVLTKARLGAKAAVELGNRIQQSSAFLLISLTAEDRKTTWDIFSRYADKEWSYVDCTILALARRLDVFQVFSFDHHINQMAEVTRVP